jgi:hypothetical protein
VTRPPWLRASTIRLLPGLVLVLSGGGSLAATYPVSAHLTLAPQQSQHCLKIAGGGPTDCSVVEEAHAAFTEAAARMFESAPNPNLELVLTVENAEVFETATGGFTFDVVTRVRIQSAAGNLLDEIKSLGRAEVMETTSVKAAAAAATQAAARDFETEYARSRRVSDYLAANEIAPSSAVGIPRRGERLMSFAVGLGGVQGGGDDDLAVAPSLRFMESFHLFTLQLVYSHYTSSFQSVLPGFSGLGPQANLHTHDLGLEAGATIHMTPSIELHAGPGIHVLFGNSAAEIRSGEESNSSFFGRVSPTLFASVTTSILPFRSGFRFLLGAEARAYFATTVDAPDLSRRVPVANTSFAVFFGGELPSGPEKGRVP